MVLILFTESKYSTIPKPQREGAVTRPEKMEKLRIQNEKGFIAKPTATKISTVGLGVQQIKKIEPKQQPVQVIPQKPVQKATSMLNANDPFGNEHQVKHFSALSQPPNTLVGNSFGKAGFSLSFTSPVSATSGTFSVTQPLLGTSTFGTQKFELNKPKEAILPFGENKHLQTGQDVKVSDKAESVDTLVSFGSKTDRYEIHKEPTAISFTPKVVSGDGNKQISVVDHTLLSDEKVAVGKFLDKNSESKIDQSSTFPPVNLVVSNEQTSQSEGTKFLPTSGFFNVTLKPSASSNSKTTNLTIPTAVVTVTTSTPSSSAVSTLMGNYQVPNTTGHLEKATEKSNILSAETSSKISDSNSSTITSPSPSSQNVFDMSALSVPSKSTVLSTATTTTVTSLNTLSTTATTTTFSFATLVPNVPSGITTTSLTQSTTGPLTQPVKPDINADNFVENLSICKPIGLEGASTPKTSSNLFGSSPFSLTAFATSAPTDDTNSIFGNVATTSSVLPVAAQTKPSLVTTSLVDGSTNAPLPLTSTSAVASFPVSSVVTLPSSSELTSVTPAATSFSPLIKTWEFGSVNAVSIPTTSFGGNTSTTSIFGGTPATSSAQFGEIKPSTLFSAATSSSPIFCTTANTTSVSVFGGTTLNTSSAPFGPTSSGSGSLFANNNTPSPAFTNAASTTSSSIFGGSPSITSSGSIFGGIPKPDQSAFAVTSTEGMSSFGNSNVGTTLFRSPTTTQPISGNNIFGATVQVGFGTQPTTSTGSIFGGGTSVSQSSSPFGTGTSSEPTTNVFASSPQGNQGGGGSIFGSTFGTSGQTASIFGGGGNTGTPTFGGTSFSQNASPFGTSNQQNSPFGGGTATSVFGQSSFGSPSPFGSPTVAFGSTSPGGSFAQGGAPVAQTGFGSPSGSFTKPAFGNTPAFGSAPAFGGAPIFGGVSSFANPKNTFTAFGANNTGAFSPPTQKNALFESLGSTDTGLSFGNLAQNTNPSTAKPQFGGSQFSTWR